MGLEALLYKCGEEVGTDRLYVGDASKLQYSTTTRAHRVRLFFTTAKRTLPAALRVSCSGRHYTTVLEYWQYKY